MTENKTYGEGFYIIGGESGGKVRLSKEGRRVLNIDKKAIKEQKFFDYVLDRTIKKQNTNNLLVIGTKKLVVAALLLASLNANGNTGYGVIAGKPKAKEQKEITPKDQLKTAGQIILTFAVMIGSSALFICAESKETERKLAAMKKYEEQKVK